MSIKGIEPEQLLLLSLGRLSFIKKKSRNCKLSNLLSYFSMVLNIDFPVISIPTERNSLFVDASHLTCV